MEEFYQRKDRFDFFESFEKPLLNICFDLEMPDFRPFCKDKGFPVFHFFLYHLFQSLNQVDNFKYRILNGEVIKIEKFISSYTVINDKNLFNYTRFEFDDDIKKFIHNSLQAREVALRSPSLINTGTELTERELKNYVFITSMPWLRFTSIEHPVYRFKSSDIPSIAWGKFVPSSSGNMIVPISVQAHHGFVDGYHVYLLGEKIKESISTFMMS